MRAPSSHSSSCSPPTAATSLPRGGAWTRRCHTCSSPPIDRGAGSACSPTGRRRARGRPRRINTYACATRRRQRLRSPLRRFAGARGRDATAGTPATRRCDRDRAVPSPKCSREHGDAQASSAMAGFEVSRALGGGEIEVRFPIATTERRARGGERDHIAVAASLQPLLLLPPSRSSAPQAPRLHRRRALPQHLAADFNGAAYPVNGRAKLSPACAAVTARSTRSRTTSISP